MREQSGASRRTSQWPWKRTQGSLTRMAEFTNLARDEGAFPGGQRQDSGMSQAPEAGDSAFQLVGAAGLGQGGLNELARFARGLGGVRRALLHFCPEAHRIAQFAERQHAQPLVVLCQYEGFAARC